MVGGLSLTSLLVYVLVDLLLYLSSQGRKGFFSPHPPLAAASEPKISMDDPMDVDEESLSEVSEHPSANRQYIMRTPRFR